MFNLNDKVKINEELCPLDKRTEKRFQFGSLNYLALMLDWEFEVERVFKDDYHGDMVECKVTNVEDIKSNVVLKSADIVLAAKTMVKMDFEIIGKGNKFQADIDQLIAKHDELVKFRATEKKKGGQITSKYLIDNWNEIKSIRAKIKKLEENVVNVFNIKHKRGIFQLDCKEEDIPRLLRKEIRDRRVLSRKFYPTVKAIGGGMTYNTVGGVLEKAGKFLELNEKFALNIIKEAKIPKTADNYVGIEIEMLSPKDITGMNKEFIKARLHRYVNVGTDGSIQVETTGFNAMELRICLPESLLETKLKEICDVLRKNDCYANRSCGMHVHIDMRNRNPELCYRNFFKLQDIMLESQPQSRRKNKYCVPNTLADLKLKDFSLGGGDEGRRHVINTQSYTKNNMKTIEIRVHEGATKYRDVINWVKFLVATASLTTELEAPIKNIDQLKKASYLNDNIINHIEERILEFSA